MAVDFFGDSSPGSAGFGGSDGSLGDWSPRGGGGDSGGGLFGGGGGGDFGGAFGGIFKGVGGLFGGIMDSKAYDAQKQSYEEAAKISEENAKLEQEAVHLKEFQEERKVNKTLGTIRAGEAASGFGAGGSSLYLLRESAMQGGLAKGGIELQGAIETNAYLQQAAKARGEAKAAAAASQKSMFGGIFSALSSIVSLF